MGKSEQIEVPDWVTLLEPSRTKLDQQSESLLEITTAFSMKTIAIGCMLVLVSPLFLLLELKEKIAGPTGFSVFFALGFGLLGREVLWYIRHKGDGKRIRLEREMVQVEDMRTKKKCVFRREEVILRCGYNSHEFDGDRWKYHGKSGMSIRPAKCAFLAHPASRFCILGEHSEAPNVLDLAKFLSQPHSS